MVSELEMNMCNAKLFGKIFKNLEVRPDLQIDDIYNIFQHYPLIHDDINMLNSVLTEEEICNSLKNLRKGKAAGPDGLVAEMFLSTSHIVVPYLLKLFIVFFQQAYFLKCGQNLS